MIMQSYPDFVKSKSINAFPQIPFVSAERPPDMRASEIK